MALALVAVITSCSILEGEVATGPAETATTVVASDPDVADPSDTAGNDGAAEDDDTDARSPERSCEGAAAPLDNPDQETMVVFATCAGADEPPFPLTRPTERSDLDEILARLTDGLTDAERDAGLFSWFDASSPVTATADVDGDGVALIRFEQDGEPWRPGASTSSQTLSLVDPIAATVFANTSVAGIDRAGLCYGELDCDGVLLRGDFDQTMFLNHGVIASTACGLVGYWERPTTCDAAAIHAEGRLRDAVVANVADDDLLNMRATASADAFIVGTLPNGTSVDAAEATASSPDGGSWQLIFDRFGTPGWVNTAFLDFEAVEKPDSGNVDFEAIAKNFISFARSLPANASNGDDDGAVAEASETLAAIPFAASVSLGLGETLLATEAREDLVVLDRWRMDVDLFRGYVGSFSIVGPLRTAAEFDTTVGPHDHCASPPMPVPDGLEDATIISIQPAEGSIDSCLRWFAIDLFLDESDEIVAVTFDTWEP